MGSIPGLDVSAIAIQRLTFVKGAWAYVKGGMGSISNAIATVAREHGAEIATNATVKRILYEDGDAGKPAKVTGMKASLMIYSTSKELRWPMERNSLLLR